MRRRRCARSRPIKAGCAAWRSARMDKQVATAGNDRSVRVWNLADGTKVQEFTGHEVPIYSLLWHPSGQALVSGDLRGNVKQWDLSSAAATRSFDAEACIRSMVVSRLILAACAAWPSVPTASISPAPACTNRRIPWARCWSRWCCSSSGNRKSSCSSTSPRGSKVPMWRVQYLADGTLMGVMGGSGGGFLFFWKPDQAKEIHRFNLTVLARDMDLHPDGLQVATTHTDKHLPLSKLAAKAG